MKTEREPITSFTKKNRKGSNFWPARVTRDNITYPSTEQGYKASKTLDMEARRQIAALEPNKRDLGEKIEAILATVPQRDDWCDAMRLEVMEDLLNQKFDGRDPAVRQWLIDTGDADLIEGNDWGDTFFGVCNGVGKNHLGKLLMKIRTRIIQEEQQPAWFEGV